MDTLAKLLEIDEKHNDILKRLAELDVRVMETLKEWSGGDEPKQEKRFENCTKSSIIPLPESGVFSDARQTFL